MVEFVKKYNLLTDHQSGFRTQHSCSTALTEVIEDMRNSLDDAQRGILPDNLAKSNRSVL